MVHRRAKTDKIFVLLRNRGVWNHPSVLEGTPAGQDFVRPERPHDERLVPRVPEARHVTEICVGTARMQ